MLHNITDDGMLSWHCDASTCAHHNCAEWHPERACPHHADQDQAGATRTAHISHEEVVHPTQLDGTPNTSLVALPRCACGSLLTLNIGFTPEELAEPTIVRAPDGSIVSVTVNGASNLTIIDVEEIQQDVEDPILALLRKHGVDVPIVLRRATLTRIKEVRRPYWLEHHAKLAQMMREKTA